MDSQVDLLGFVMAGRTLKLGCPDVAAVIDQKHRGEKPGWRKDRLLVIKLASRGEHTSQQIAELCGLSRSKVFELVKAVREGGLVAIWERDPGGRPEGWRKGVSAEVVKEFEQKLANHEFTTLQDARRWLESYHGIESSYQRVWYWAKKLGGVLRVPRPSHSRKKPAGSSSGGGLPIKYEWDYLYGSLEVTGGECHFCQISGVNLQWDRQYLGDLASNDPEVVHILIRDQAGFHLRDGDPRLPTNVRIIDLPPYSPELNPCEQLWDLIKDELGNRVFETIEKLREATIPILKSWWEDTQRVLSLIGRPWLQDQANASSKTLKSRANF